jgi:hypothetical protein
VARVLVLLTLALPLALPATASAAPFGELGFRPAGGTATCLRATGLPGELVRSTATGAQFLQAGPAGLTPRAEVASDGTATQTCPQAAARGNGTGVLAFALDGERSDEGFVRVSLREPGGAWGRYADPIATGEIASAHPLAADVSERGDALVAVATRDRDERMRILVARRAPGGAFGAPEAVFSSPEDASRQVRLLAGVSAGGDAVLAWSFQAVADRPRELWAAIAPAGAPFAAPVRLATLRIGSSFSLAVGDAGHALLAFASGDDVLVAERAPGGAFGAPAPIGRTEDMIGVAPAAAVRADGAAIVAWNNQLAGDVHAVVRPAGGPFGAPVTLARPSGLRFPRRILDLYKALLGAEAPGQYTTTAASPDDDGGSARALITPDGRGAVTWTAPIGRDGVWQSLPHVAAVPLTGGTPTMTTLGAELREGEATTPLIAAGGTLGVAWADNGEAGRDGRLHLALEGVADGPEPAAPEVTISTPRRRVLAADEDLRLRVRCSAACDVRVQAGDGALAPSDDFSLARAGAREVRLSAVLEPLATVRGGPVRLRVRYGAPGARRAVARTVTNRLRRLPDAPLPKLLGVTARRSGKAVVVTWRTDRDMKAADFAVAAARTRGAAFELELSTDAHGSGRRFRARLTNAGDARFVRIYTRVPGRREAGTTTVRIRG